MPIAMSLCWKKLSIRVDGSKGGYEPHRSCWRYVKVDKEVGTAATLEVKGPSNPVLGRRALNGGSDDDLGNRERGQQEDDHHLLVLGRKRHSRYHQMDATANHGLREVE